MPLEDRWEDVVSGRRTGLGAAAVRAGLHAAALLYWFGLEANLGLYSSGLKSRTRPALPVISVGNLSLGGAGKTTAAAFIARRLSVHCRPAVVLRGYRSRGPAPLLVSDGETVRAGLAEAGDEAVMLASMLPGCVVAVGRRREAVIRLLAEHTGAQVVVLDDGFQYFRMEHNVDVVLLDALADESSWRLFPAGRLREPPSHLRRAHQVWITHADLAPRERVTSLQALARRMCPTGVVVTTRHRPGALRSLTGDPAPASVQGQAVIALSALGNPRSFELSLEALGTRVTPLRFADHHAYAPNDWQRVMHAAAAAQAQWVVTTEKDAVKLPPPPADCPPVLVLGCELEVLEGEAEMERGLMSLGILPDG